MLTGEGREAMRLREQLERLADFLHREYRDECPKGHIYKPDDAYAVDMAIRLLTKGAWGKPGTGLFRFTRSYQEGSPAERRVWDLLGRVEELEAAVKGLKEKDVQSHCCKWRECLSCRRPNCRDRWMGDA